MSISKRFRLARLAQRTDRDYQFWQEGVHAELMFNETIMRQLWIIFHNPVKRGYVALPEHWRYSSAGFYAGLGGLIEMDKW